MNDTVIDQRLALIREQMSLERLDALIVPRADEYLGEYVPEHNERLKWVSGFTGSAGAAVVLADRAAIFVDGRYTVQVRQQVSEARFAYRHLIEEPPARWLAAELGEGARVGYDPRVHTLAWVRRTTEALAPSGIELVPTEGNLVDRCWHDRPVPVVHPALLYPEQYSGKSCVQKRHEIAAAIAEKGVDAALIFAADSVAWLLNIRGNDVPHLPLVLGFALLSANTDVLFFTDPSKIPPGFHDHVGPGVTVLPEAQAPRVLASMSEMKVLADPDTANAWSQLALEAGGAELVAGPDPVILPKACKNETEVAGMRAAHVRDGAAETRFLAWLDRELAAGRLHDEATLSDRVAAFRAEQPLFRDLSFDTISAAAGNAAIVHYRHDDAAPGRLLMDNVYLLDSGAQYLDGTTDITRTIAIGDPGAEIRRVFTLVLKGHVAISRARFPAGTCGAQLDVLARQFLWQEGLDYDHGTGHGVGSYLSVHEGPQNLSRRGAAELRTGMVISNEPGFYKAGCYGIRCENLLLVTALEPPPGSTMTLLGFEPLTRVPFDRRLIAVEMLSREELAWLDDYHARVLAEVGPLLPAEDLAWLREATAPLRA